MTSAADLILTNGRVHTLTGDGSGDADGEPTAEALAIRDGRIVRVGSAYDVEFLEGVGTQVVDLDGGVVLPGFVDAHTHLDIVGRRAVEADLTDADSLEACLDRLRDQAQNEVGDERRHDAGDEWGSDERESGGRADGWILGFGYDESAWGGDYLTRADLDAVSDERPVAAFREDMHVVSVNSVALDRHREAMPAADVRTEGGDPTGVLVEAAAEAVFEAIRPDAGTMREYLLAAQRHANERGVTAVHEMVRKSAAPRVYRDLDAAGELTLRVRLNYWADHLDAVLETGLRTNHGTDRLRVGAIKTYADGSIGGQTARLSEPYADAEAGGGEGTADADGDAGADAEEDDDRGVWVETPEDLRALVERVDGAGLQMATHAIGDEAIRAVLDAFEDTAGQRHRIEHAEVLTDDLVERLAEADVVVSAQPNFVKWAREGGLYDRRLGVERRRRTNQFGALRDAGARLAFGSDCMPLDPLFGVQQAVTAPEPEQRLSVSAAVRAYTRGGAYAGFDEDRLGTIEVGKHGDCVVLADSPWEVDPADIADIAVEMTVVGGDVVWRT